MKNVRSRIKLVIKENFIGYGLYEEPHWFDGQLIEPCYYTAKTKEPLKKWINEHPVYYLEEEIKRTCDVTNKEETTKKCSDCYWYSDVTVQACDKEHEPTKPDNPACDQFEQK